MEEIGSTPNNDINHDMYKSDDEHTGRGKLLKERIFPDKLCAILILENRRNFFQV